jgi:Glycosyltransferase like family
MLPITVVSATRYDQRDFYLRSALGRSLSQTYSNFPVKPKFYFSNVKALSVCYNDAIASAVDPEEMLVFIHDDVFIVDFFWVDKLYWGFERFDILGLAGNKRRVPRQPSWAFIDEKFTWDQPSNLSGMVGHGRQFPCQLSVYGQLGQQCKLLDGVLLATKKSTLEKNDICFDENFDFHFYDLDLCRQAEERNLRMGTIPLGVIHESGGAFGSPQWRKNYDKYLMKWKE